MFPSDAMPPDLPVLTGVQTVVSVIQVELVSCDGDGEMCLCHYSSIFYTKWLSLYKSRAETSSLRLVSTGLLRAELIHFQ